MPFKIASLTSSDTTLKVLRGKPFSIALSSFLTPTADETGESIDFSSSLLNAGEVQNPTAGTAGFQDTPNGTVNYNGGIVQLELTTWRLKPSRFASVTCDHLPNGVSLVKEIKNIIYYCSPIDLLINTIPSNNRIQGVLNNSGTYEFYLTADILSIPEQYYTFPYTSNVQYNAANGISMVNPFISPPHIDPKFAASSNTPLTIGDNLSTNIVRLSSDTIKVTIIVEDLPTISGTGTGTGTGTTEYQFLTPAFYGTATTGSSTNSVDLHTDPVSTSLLTSSSKSINTQYSTTRVATSSSQNQTYDLILGGVSVLSEPFSFSSSPATTAAISFQIKRTSSSNYKIDTVINYSVGGSTSSIKTHSKNISLGSLSGSNLILRVTNAAGIDAPIISDRSEIALVG